jgi:co-chaperonin GroES (HSP10)
MSVVKRAMLMHHDVDPRQTIMADMAPHLEKFLCGGPDVLIAIYVRTGKTQSGIYIPGQTSDEDKYQGKAALVLQIGAKAFSAERGTADWFGDREVMVGDWVAVNVNDTFPVLIGDRSCRLVEDKYVRAILQTPDLIM